MGAPHRGKKIMPRPSPTMPDSLGSFPAHIYAESSVLSHSTDSTEGVAVPQGWDLTISHIRSLQLTWQYFSLQSLREPTIPMCLRESD